MILLVLNILAYLDPRIKDWENLEIAPKMILSEFLGVLVPGGVKMESEWCKD